MWGQSVDSITKNLTRMVEKLQLHAERNAAAAIRLQTKGDKVVEKSNGKVIRLEQKAAKKVEKIDAKAQVKVETLEARAARASEESTRAASIAQKIAKLLS